MVTARQFGRGVARTVRAMEKDAARAQRQRIAYAKAVEKQATLDAAADEAEAYDDLIRILTAAHRKAFQPRDWNTVAQEEPPPDAERSDVMERAAAATLASYSPGWFARTFGFAEPKRAKLSAAVAHGQAADEEAFSHATDEVARRRQAIAFARSVLAREREALTEAVTQYANFSGVSIEDLNALFLDRRMIAVVDGLEQDDLPSHSVTLLQSGKMSRKPLTAGRILELHRDYVCSTGIRIAKEFLEVTGLDEVEVVIHADLLERASGHLRPSPVFYARVTAQALSAVNLTLAEPEPLAERLGAKFDWSRREGFRQIDLAPFGVPADLVGAGPG